MRVAVLVVVAVTCVAAYCRADDVAWAVRYRRRSEELQERCLREYERVRAEATELRQKARADGDEVQAARAEEAWQHCEEPLDLLRGNMALPDPLLDERADGAGFDMQVEDAGTFYNPVRVSRVIDENRAIIQPHRGTAFLLEGIGTANWTPDQKVRLGEIGDGLFRAVGAEEVALQANNRKIVRVLKVLPFSADDLKTVVSPTRDRVRWPEARGLSVAENRSEQDDAARMEALVKAAETATRERIALLRSQLKDAEARLKVLRAGVVGQPKSPRRKDAMIFKSEEEKTAALSKEQNDQKTMRDLLDRLTKREAWIWPSIPLMKVGDVGRLDGTVRLSKIIDDRNAVATIVLERRQIVVWLRGWETTNWPNDQDLDLDAPLVEVTGVEVLEDRLFGQPRTVLRLEPLAESRTAPYLKKLRPGGR